MKKVKIPKKLLHDCLWFWFWKCYIRRRDTNEQWYWTCISSWQMLYRLNWQAGHYIPNGSCKYLTWNEDNVHMQSMADNVWKHWNLIRYRENLIKKIWIEKVEELESCKNNIKQWKEYEMLEMINKYKEKAKQLISTKTINVQLEILRYLHDRDTKKRQKLYQ